MKRLVVLFGPSAVGKMTVGTALAQQTGLKLFTNHMTIEMVRHVFPQGQTFRKLVMEFRRRIIEEAATVPSASSVLCRGRGRGLLKRIQTWRGPFG